MNQTLQSIIEGLEGMKQDPYQIRDDVYADIKEKWGQPNEKDWESATNSGAFAFAYNAAIEDAIELINNLTKE